MKVEQMWQIADEQIELSEFDSTQELRELCMHCMSVAINHQDLAEYIIAEYERTKKE